MRRTIFVNQLASVFRLRALQKGHIPLHPPNEKSIVGKEVRPLRYLSKIPSLFTKIISLNCELYKGTASELYRTSTTFIGTLPNRLFSDPNLAASRGQTLSLSLCLVILAVLLVIGEEEKVHLH